MVQKFTSRDPLHVVIRRKAQGRELRSAMYFGKPTSVPDGRTLTWAALFRDMREPGYFGTQELFDIAKAFSLECPLPRPTRFDQDQDLELLKALEAHLVQRRRDERRWERSFSSAERAYHRQEEMAKQALLDGLCPWDGTFLPCPDHGIGKVKVDGHGGLLEYDRPPVRSPLPCGSPASTAASQRLRSASGA